MFSIYIDRWSLTRVRASERANRRECGLWRLYRITSKRIGGAIKLRHARASSIDNVEDIHSNASTDTCKRKYPVTNEDTLVRSVSRYSYEYLTHTPIQTSWRLDKNRYVDYRVDMPEHTYKVYKYIINTRLPIRIGNDTENMNVVNNSRPRFERYLDVTEVYLDAVLAILSSSTTRENT